MMPAQTPRTTQGLRSCGQKHLESPTALPALPEWDGNVSPGAESQPLGFGSKPPWFSIQVFVLPLLLIFNSAFYSVAFISDSSSGLSSSLPPTGMGFQALLLCRSS